MPPDATAERAEAPAAAAPDSAPTPAPSDEAALMASWQDAWEPPASTRDDAARDPAPQAPAEGTGTPAEGDQPSKPDGEHAEPKGEPAPEAKPERGKAEPGAPEAKPDAEPSRRQSARERDADEIARLRAEWEAERAEKDREKARADELEAERERVNREALAALGTDQEFNDLLDEAKQAGIEGTAMPYDRAQRLQALEQARAYYRVYLDDADLRYRQHYARETLEAANAKSVDRDALLALAKPGSGPRDILAGFFDLGAKSRESEVAELKDRVSQLEADNAALLARTAGGAAAPERGGDPAPAEPSDPNTFDPNRSAEWNLAAAFSRPLGNGRRAR